MTGDRISRRRVLAAAGGVGVAAVRRGRVHGGRSLRSPPSRQGSAWSACSRTVPAPKPSDPRTSLASRARLRSGISWT